MKLLLTSGGVTNATIRSALESLLGTPVSEASALLIPTAQWGQPACTPTSIFNTVADRWPGETGLTGLGWKSVGLLELTALPTIGVDRWRSWVEDADVLLVDGGDAVYLSTWVEQSGLGAVLPSLTDTVWVGVSAGSMALTPRVGRHFVDWQPGGPDTTLGLVDFSIFPHLDYPGWDQNTLAVADAWAQHIDAPAFALDDQSAIVVDGGDVRVVSEGQWHRYERGERVESSGSAYSVDRGSSTRSR